MTCKRSPAKNGYLTILCCITAAILSMVFVECREFTEKPLSPNLDGLNGSKSEAQAASAFLLETAPILTVTNEYMDPVVTPRAVAFMKIPEGIPLTFCWTAKKASNGANIKAYRYGWDIFDPDDPENWDVDLTAYDGSEICAPSRTFNTRSVHFFTVEVFDDEDASSRISIALDIVRGPASFDVMPGSCKNPFNIKRKGKIRTVIPGRIGLDVSEIDISSLYLWVDGNVVEPVDIKVRDIASPMINRIPCDCPPAGKDGITDLLILFAATDIIRAMGPVSKGETRELSIHGVLSDGYKFALKDCVVIVGNPPAGDDPALFQRDAVLVALQRAYNEKNFQKASTLFDDDFTFFFSEADIQRGYVTVGQWGRGDELIATANLFNVDNSADAPIIGFMRNNIKHVGAVEEISWGKIKWNFFNEASDAQTFIVLLLIFAQGEENWISVMPPDPAQYPGEVWYEKSATYYLMVQTGEVSFVTNMLRVLFTVRFSETKGYWQLVLWRDDI